VDYHRIDFSRHRVINSNILTFDYWDYWNEDLVPLLAEGERLARVELARCHPKHPERRDAHLFLVETTSEDGNRRGWIWHKAGGIESVRNPSQRESLQVTGKTLVGPLETSGKLYLVDWVGEKGTPVSFDIDDHDDQVRQYLADGYFSLQEDAPYNVGGKIGGDTRIYKSNDPIFISGNELALQYEENVTSSRPCLNFNPRELANFYDKDSFKIFYSGEEQAFVIQALAHRKRSITPKTVFMVIPEGGHAILGSHALSPIKLPAGINTIVLPGITFKLSQGPVYYA